VKLIVVGAGLIGCAIARFTALAGAEVVVIDPDEPGKHASWAAAGMLSPQAESESNDDFLSLLLEARALYPTIVRALAEETGIDVLYRTEGSLLLALSDEDEPRLDSRYAWQTHAGLPVERLLAEDARKLEPSINPDVRNALFFPGDHQVENRLLSAALAKSASRAGARFVRARVLELTRDHTPGVRTDLAGAIDADAVVIAAGSWSGRIAGLPRELHVEPILGQLVSYRASPLPVAHTVLSHRGYLVPRTDGRLIAGATMERVGYDLQLTEEGKQKVARSAAELVPLLGSMPVDAHWAGLRPGTPDGMPVLGPDPTVEGLYYATGHYRNGVLLAPLTGELIGRMVLGSHPGIDLTSFRPDRFGAGFTA
jgi:glycine oxidase